MILPSEIINKREHGDVRLIHKSTQIAESTIKTAFTRKRGKDDVVLAIIEYYRIKGGNTNHIKRNNEKDSN